MKSVSLTRPQTSRRHLPSAVLPHPLCRQLPDNTGTQLSSGPLESFWGTPAQPDPNPAVGSAEVLPGGGEASANLHLWRGSSRSSTRGVFGHPSTAPKGARGTPGGLNPNLLFTCSRVRLLHQKTPRKMSENSSVIRWISCRE